MTEFEILDRDTSGASIPAKVETRVAKSPTANATALSAINLFIDLTTKITKSAWTIH